MSNINADRRFASDCGAVPVPVVGCLKPPVETDSGFADEEPDVASASMIDEVDEMCEEILRSPDTVAAASWLGRYPMSSFGDDEEGEPMLLSSYVKRFEEAGVERVVIESAKLGGGEFLVGMIVVLPADAAARENVFALEPELSALCDQTSVIDRGEKYLHYSFD
jgi:hypothetical protein